MRIVFGVLQIRLVLNAKLLELLFRINWAGMELLGTWLGLLLLFAILLLDVKFAIELFCHLDVAVSPCISLDRLIVCVLLPSLKPFHAQDMIDLPGLLRQYRSFSH